MKTLGLFEALAILEFDQVLIQVSDVADGYNYSQSGAVVHWGRDGMLTDYKTGYKMSVGKPLEGENAKYIIKNISELED